MCDNQLVTSYFTGSLGKGEAPDAMRLVRCCQVTSHEFFWNPLDWLPSLLPTHPTYESNRIGTISSRRILALSRI